MKKDIFLFYVLAVLFGLGVAGCEQQKVERYENDPRLNFYRGMDYDRTPVFRQGDSTAQSFFVVPESQDRDTVYVAIETMGMTSAEARPFRLVQTNTGDSDAAVAGKHYVAFDAEEMREAMMIPPGCVRYFMPLVVLRDPSLKNSKIRLKMAIAENDYFKVGFKENSKLMVTMTAMPAKPSNWSSWSSSFGTWGPQKMWFIVNYVGVTDFSNAPGDSAYRYYLKALAITRLRAYNADEHNPDRPLREADGTEVDFEK